MIPDIEVSNLQSVKVYEDVVVVGLMVKVVEELELGRWRECVRGMSGEGF